MSSQTFLINDEPVTVHTEKAGDGWTATVANRTFAIKPIGEHLYSVTLDGKTYRAAAVKGKDSWYLDIDSVLVEAFDEEELGFSSAADHHHGHSKDKVFAPMPGKVVKLLVKVGDAVTAKQPLVIVEAMKMENNVLAAANGTVKAVHFAAGDQVGTDQPIIELDLQ